MSCPCPRCAREFRRRKLGISTEPFRIRALETVSDSTPILATRAARVRRAPRNMFGSVNQSSQFNWWGVEETARCRRGLTHYPRCPGAACECGFYAVPSDRTPVYGGPQYVQLDVELAGRVIVHTRGYRAEWQRVLGVRVTACPTCGGRRSGCAVWPGVARMMPWIFCPNCQDPNHALHQGPRIREAEWLLEKLPVPWTVEGSDG